MSLVKHRKLGITFLVEAKNRPKYVAYVQYSNGNIYVNVVDSDTRSLVGTYCYNRANFRKFVDEVPKNFQSFKAVICNLFGFVTDDFPINILFCKQVKQILDELNVPCYFLSHDDIYATMLLVTAKPVVKFGDTLLLVFVNDDSFVNVIEVDYSSEGYTYESARKVRIVMNDPFKVVKDSIMGDCEPRHVLVLVTKESPLTKLLKTKYLKIRKAKFFNVNAFDQMTETLVEITRWLLDKSYTTFYLKQILVRQYSIVQIGKLVTFGNPHEIGSTLPCRSRCMVDDHSCLYSLTSKEFGANDYQVVQSVTLPHRPQRHVITLEIDIENIPHLEVESLVDHTLRRIGKLSKDNAPVVSFYDTKSILMIRDDSTGAYRFSISCKYPYGRPTYISFDEEKPKFFEDALKVLRENPACVLYDLVKIISMPNDDIKVDPKWNFSITNDEENPVVLRFEQCGKPKVSTPAFLMALLIKAHRRAVRDETGERPTSMGFIFTDKVENFEERERAEAVTKEACKLLNLECFFIAP